MIRRRQYPDSDRAEDGPARGCVHPRRRSGPGRTAREIYETATIQSALIPLALPGRPIRNRLRSLFLALRRSGRRGAPGQDRGDSATSGITLVQKPTVPSSKEPPLVTFASGFTSAIAAKTRVSSRRVHASRASTQTPHPN